MSNATEQSSANASAPFPSQGAAQPTLKVVIVQEYCTHAQGSDCTRCAYCCPYDAISLPETAGAPTVDNDLCNGCGICYGVCDVFASTRITLSDLHDRLKRAALRKHRAYLTCTQYVPANARPDDNVVVLPCLAMVPPELWTLLLAENVPLSVACDFDACEVCERTRGTGGALYPRAIEAAQEATGRQVSFAESLPEQEESLISKYTHDSAGTDRREALTSVAHDLADVASGNRRRRQSTVLADFYARRERMHAQARLAVAENSPFASFVPAGAVKRTLVPKRKWLLQAIDREPECAAKIDLALSSTDPERCEESHECARRCPTGARAVAPETGALSYEPAYCIGCGICVEACPQGACDVEPKPAEALKPFLSKMKGEDRAEES